MEPRTLLVADADRKLRALIKSRLQAEGWRVQEAATGLQALAVCACRRVDVVLADLNLPDIRGEALIQALAERFPAVVILAMSAKPPQEQPAGVWEVFSKPLDVEAVLSRARQCLEAPPKKSASSAAPALYRFRRHSSSKL